MNLDRRHLLIGASAMAVCTSLRSARAASDELSFDQVIEALQIADVTFEGAGGSLEAKDAWASGIISPAGISNGNKSKTPIASEAVKLIVLFEVTGRKTYTKRYTGLIWPRGRSGVTMGIGYDIGYVDRDRLREDWKDYISGKDIDNLKIACGVTGKKARDLLPTMPPFSLEYDMAFAQFDKEGVPRYVGEVEANLPNTALLSAKSLGALVSLDYNRGATFRVRKERDPTGRYEEMRNIYAHMKAKQFDLIPDEFRKMKRLWQNKPDMSGLLTRRELEAQLFKSGL